MVGSGAPWLEAVTATGLALVGVDGRVCASNARFRQMLDLGDDGLSLVRADELRRRRADVHWDETLLPDGETLVQLTPLARQPDVPSAAEAGLFRTVFTQAPVGLLVRSLEGRTLLANPAAARLLGYPPDELLRVGLADLVHPEDAEAEHEAFDRFRAGRSERYASEQRFLGRDGDPVWLHVESTLVPGWGATRACVVSQLVDVTEQRLADDARAAGERRYVALARSRPEYVFRVSAAAELGTCTRRPRRGRRGPMPRRPRSAGPCTTCCRCGRPPD
jgi:PAS domain S-box-containing protein